MAEIYVDVVHVPSGETTRRLGPFRTAHEGHTASTLDAGQPLVWEAVPGWWLAEKYPLQWQIRRKELVAEGAAMTVYREVHLDPAPRGEWLRVGHATKLYNALGDLAANQDGVVAYLSTEDAAWRAHPDSELVQALEDLVGLVHDEPEFLLAWRMSYGGVGVTGVERVEALQGPDGELTAVE